MKYQFRPYAKMQPTEVTLTGKVYEKGEHPLYTEHKIIEVVDEEGSMSIVYLDISISCFITNLLAVSLTFCFVSSDVSDKIFAVVFVLILLVLF